MLQRLRDAAGRLKRELAALFIAARDPRTPWQAKLLLAIVLAYAASPIDLIPDFIPLLGYLDELLLLPLAIWLALRLIPPQVMQQARDEAARRTEQRRPDYRAAAVIAIVWLLVLWLTARWVWEVWKVWPDG